MSEVCRVVFVLRDGTEEVVDRPVRVRFYKDRFLPATRLSGKVLWDGQVRDVLAVKLRAGGHTLHHGYAEYIAVRREKGRAEVSFSSPGWSNLLSQNEPVPGMNYSMTLDQLLAANVSIPYVTCESGTQQVNYIYVKEHSTIWDAVTAYSRKAYGTFPFIYSNNKVSVQELTGTARAYGPSAVIGFGTELDRRLMLSKAYMADIDGQYSYSAVNPQAAADGIVREKYFALDRQWLGNPSEGPAIRVDISKRKYCTAYVKVLGYQGEELFDSINASSGSRSLLGTVGGIEIIFENGRAVTKLSVFS